jgi:quinol monooxygenase YgiN
MIIISGKVYVAAGERAIYVSKFAEMVQRARAFPGCIDLVIAADPLESDRINMYECFESEERLAAWRAVAHAPKTGIELLQADVQKHKVSESGPPFP